MQLADLKRRVEKLARRPERVQYVIKSQLLGPPEWSDADGWRLYFLEYDGGTWTDAEKAAELADHLGVSHREALHLVAAEDSR